MLLDADVTQKEWSQKINKKGELTCHLKVGTEICPDKFLIKGVTYFNKSFNKERIVKSVSKYTQLTIIQLYDAKHRNTWDKKQMEILYSMNTPHRNVRLTFFRYKKFLCFDPKEFSDKMIQFSHNDCIYSYSTTNGQRETQTAHFKSKAKKVDTCDTIIAISRYSIDKETDKVISEALVQSDSKLEIVPKWMMAATLPGALEKYIKDWKGYVLKEHNGKLA